jgi:hypothetical protein
MRSIVAGADLKRICAGCARRIKLRAHGLCSGCYTRRFRGQDRQGPPLSHQARGRLGGDALAARSTPDQRVARGAWASLHSPVARERVHQPLWLRAAQNYDRPVTVGSGVIAKRRPHRSYTA